MSKKQSQQNIYFDKEEEELSKYIENTALKPLAKNKKDEMIDGLASAVKNTLSVLHKHIFS